MNKAKLIREMKEKYPSYTSRQIAGIIDVKQGYAAHILWKAKQPTIKKVDFEKAFQQQLAQNEELKKQIEQFEEELRKLRYVIKFLREN
jgi:ribosomal protein L9